MDIMEDAEAPVSVCVIFGLGVGGGGLAMSSSIDNPPLLTLWPRSVSLEVRLEDAEEEMPFSPTRCLRAGRAGGIEPLAEVRIEEESDESESENRSI